MLQTAIGCQRCLSDATDTHRMLDAFLKCKMSLWDATRKIYNATNFSGIISSIPGDSSSISGVVSSIPGDSSSMSSDASSSRSSIAIENYILLFTNEFGGGEPYR